MSVTVGGNNILNKDFYAQNYGQIDIPLNNVRVNTGQSIVFQWTAGGTGLFFETLNMGYTVDTMDILPVQFEYIRL